MKTKLLITLGVILVVVLTIYMVFGRDAGEGADILVTAEVRNFQLTIETTGELEAKNSEEILGPSNLRNFRIWNVNIQHIIDEGTLVKKGQYVAQLDPSELEGRIKDAENDLELRESQFIQTQLDTALQMRQSRDELINLQYAVEEQKLRLEQSQFEPPATIKQVEIDLDKARRALTQARENYKIKLQQNREKMREVYANLSKVKREYTAMLDLKQSFRISAPEDGMLIYHKGFDGRPIKEGSQVSGWNPVVATLPDLSQMLSRTFVNEVDIRKVAIGQSVNIGLDAFPEKRLKGRVISVANVGEQRPNSDSKVFQVNIEVLGIDETLRPAMTTSNTIIAKTIPDMLQVPLESLHNQYDSITYVFKREGMSIIKQEVEVGETNTNDAIILAGLDPGDRVYLSLPTQSLGDEIRLVPEMDGRRSPKQPDEAAPEEMPPTITLPDGRTVTMEQLRQSGGQMQMKRGEGGQRQRPGQSSDTTKVKKEGKGTEAVKP